MLHKLGWALTGALALVAILAFARATTAGDLDPPGPVGSTMRTLDQLVPSWDQTLTSSGGCASQRFTCVMGDEAVLDRETGLVWQRTPTVLGDNTWFAGNEFCAFAQTGGRKGWRAPTLHEGLSLVDPAISNLPEGHPFLSVPAQSTAYATSSSGLSATEGYIFTIGGSVGRRGKDFVSAIAYWCVRAPGGDDPA